MALPIEFDEYNACFIPAIGPGYPIWVRPCKLGESETIESITLWQLNAEELTLIRQNDWVVYLGVTDGQPPIEIIGADPVYFTGYNKVYTHPDCRDLPVLQSDVTLVGRPTIVVISAWQLHPEGREVTGTNNGILYLRIVGGHRDVTVSGYNLARRFLELKTLQTGPKNPTNDRIA